jgi:glycosyltransferase involved in cell wall biosynthesis
MSTPAFTVLLGAYNEERLVGQAIASVLTQTRTDLELVVVDDGSTDGTAEAVEDFLSDPRVRLIRQENRGPSAAFNTAAAAGSAPRLARIDADDLWLPGFLEGMDAALESAVGAGFAFTDAWWLDESSGRFFRKSNSEYLGAPVNPPQDPHALLLALLPGNWILSLTAIERAAFEEVSGYDESLPVCEDYDLWLRLLAAGYGAVRASGRLAIRRQRSVSLSRNPSALLENLEIVFDKLAHEPAVATDVRRAASTRAREVKRQARVEPNRLSPRALKWSVRSRLGQLRKRLAPGTVWHDEVPAEVREAFPEIDFSRPSQGR